MKLYKQKDDEIQYWNSIQDSFQLDHNMFSTMTKDEAKKTLGTYQIDNKLEEVPLDDSNLMQAVDWRSKGGVNAVKN